MKHTPGPWEVKQSDAEFRNPDKTDHAIIAKNGVCPGFVWEFGEEGQANARLIASAPELLEALEQVTKVAESEGWYNDFTFKRHGRKRIALDVGRQAITKAEGRT